MYIGFSGTKRTTKGVSPGCFERSSGGVRDSENPAAPVTKESNSLTKESNSLLQESNSLLQESNSLTKESNSLEVKVSKSMEECDRKWSNVKTF
jgi:hypothetical protein